VSASFEPLTLELRQPFHIAHGSSDRRHNVLLQLHGGLGEAAAVTYLGETREGIQAYFDTLDFAVLEDPFQLRDNIKRLPEGSPAARAAIDMALHDAWGQALGHPLYRLFGLDPKRIPETSLTIALASPAIMAERARSADTPLLKIKLGGGDEDQARLLAIRAATSKRLRVDANAGWTLERARYLLPLLAEHDVELVEQPLSVGDLEGLRTLAALPRRPALFVDESIKSSRDIAAHAGLVEGVVIKLAKSGGLLAARDQIAVAHALGLEVMLGCMIESTLAVTAAAHLAPLVEHVDLDGPLLIANDPFDGLRYLPGGKLELPERPGIGVVRRVAA
jgi:L-alanine-DL-glutamate epimerase-like enolase superfamily enzyme